MCAASPSGLEESAVPWRPRVATSGSECNVLCLFDVWAQNGRMIFQTISRSTPWGPRTRTKTLRRGLMVNLIIFFNLLLFEETTPRDPKNLSCQRFRWTQTLPSAAEEREGQTSAAPSGASRGQHRGTAHTASTELRAGTSSYCGSIVHISCIHDGVALPTGPRVQRPPEESLPQRHHALGHASAGRLQLSLAGSRPPREERARVQVEPRRVQSV